MADFLKAVAVTLQHEGGYQCLSEDSGNWTGGEIGKGEMKGTKYGISAAEYPTLDIKNLTEDQAIAIYKEGYWKQYYGEIADQDMASKIFDMGILFGVGSAVKAVQEVLSRHTVQDGVIGPQCLEVINACEPKGLLAEYKKELINHANKIVLARPQDKSFLSDWIARINS